jgi:uncharacterized repeat protein (TIGR04076 family)
MAKVKLTVLKRFTPEDVLGKNPSITPKFGNQACPVFKDGQEVVVGYVRDPDVFPCESAWAAIRPYLVALFAGGDLDMIGAGKPNLAVISCPDGFRPVVFKMERVAPEE